MSFAEMRKSRGEAGFEEELSIMQYLRCLVDIQVELLVGGPYITGCRFWSYQNIDGL